DARPAVVVAQQRARATERRNQARDRVRAETGNRRLAIVSARGEKGQDPMARRHRRHSRFARSRGGFTMLELLTTLIIILVLVGILLPTVKKMREKSQEAAVKAQISSLDSAIARYQQDFHSFPGPLPRSRLYVDTGTLPVGEKVYD